MRVPTRLLGWLAVIVVAMFVVAGCGSKSSTTTSTTSTKTTSNTANSAIAAEVPAAIKSRGTLRVALDASYAPNEFVGNNGQIIGMDPDLINAMAPIMGLKAQLSNASFDSIIPGLAAGKYDISLSSFTDTKAREKTVDFVTYFVAGTSFYVSTSGGPSITSLAGLCGHTVAVEKGTTQQTDAAAQATKCASSGKKLNVAVFPDQNGVNLELSSKRADVAMADSPVAAYQVKKGNGQFKLSGQPYGTQPYGIALPKGNGMAKPVLDALKVLIANGQYKTILNTWGISSGAITNPQINGATS